jgi:hypothetical protein
MVGEDTYLTERLFACRIGDVGTWLPVLRPRLLQGYGAVGLGLWCNGL